eukprot:7382406-Prymnesium_polylepis.1
MNACGVRPVVRKNFCHIAVNVIVALIAADRVIIDEISIPLVTSIGEAVCDVCVALRPAIARGAVTACAILIADDLGGRVAAIRGQQEASNKVHRRERRIEPRAVCRCINRIRRTAADIGNRIEPMIGGRACDRRASL